MTPGLNNPNLAGLGLPQPLVDAVRQVFFEIQALQAGGSGSSGGSGGLVQVIQDTLTNRDKLHAAATVPLNSLYIAIDTGAVYINRQVMYASAWVFLVQQPTVQATVGASGGSILVLTAADVNIPGAALSIQRAGAYIVTAFVTFKSNGAGDAGNDFNAHLYLNGAIQTKNISNGIPAPPQTVNTGMTWQLALSVGDILQLRASKNGGTGSSFVAGDTTISALWVKP